MTSNKENIVIRFLVFMGSRNLYQIAGIVFIASIPIVGLILINFMGAPRRIVDGVILGENQTWSIKHSYQCHVRVGTSVGILFDEYPSECRGYWRPGEKVIVEVIFGRITGPKIYSESMRRAPM